VRKISAVGNVFNIYAGDTDMTHDDLSMVINMIKSKDYGRAIEVITHGITGKDCSEESITLNVAMYGVLSLVLDAQNIPDDPFYAQAAILKIMAIFGDRGASRELERLHTRWMLSAEACYRQHEQGGKN
jgi:hypothetical protein